MKYLKDINTLEELKKAYKAWAVKLHPDNGGDAEAMKTLNNEYDILFSQLKGIHSTVDGHTYHKDTNETAAEFKDIINKVISLNINIDIVGRWIWISGNTYQYKDILKAAGFKYAPKKKMWYWHTADDKSSNKRPMTYQQIINLYGVDTVKQTVDLKTIASIE